MLLITSARDVPSRAAINVKALEAHRQDSARTLVEDITTKLPPDVPISEKSIEAILLKSKGPYTPSDIGKLMGLLADQTSYPLDTSEHGKDNAQLLGLVAIDLATYHPYESGLREAIISRIEELEQYPFYTRRQNLGDKIVSHYYIEQFAAALYIIDRTEANKYIEKYNLAISSIEHTIRMKIETN